MNAYLSSNGIELWHVAGWTMVHFLWLGALVAAAAAVFRFFLRRTSPNIRYAFMLAWLIALAALPIGTAAWIWVPSPSGRGQGEGVLTATVPTPPIIELHNPSNNTTSAELAVPSPPTSNQPLSTATPLPAQSAIRNPQSEIENAPATFPTLVITLESCIPYLPWLWLIGTPITFALLLTGIVGTRRLGRASRTITEGPIAELLAQLTTSLRIGKRVTVAVCDRIAAPVLIGILRPIILLPPAALTGWSPDEIEMVLLHELAHFRRWDNLMNLLQRLVESLLFFHPAVWLISSWVRSDREACCDAVVVTRTNRPHAYAEMLVALAAQMPRSVLFHPAASSAMAAGPLRSRIRRILQLEDDPMLVSGKSLALMLGALLVTATLGVLYVPTIGQAEESATEVTESTESKNKSEKPAVDTVTNDDWPAGVVFPSPKEGEISKRAYELLGLKIVPATDEELKTAHQKGFPYVLKILNLPSLQHAGQGPVILVSLGRAPIVDFAALDHVVTETARGRMHSGVATVELGGIAGSREFKVSLPLRPLDEVQIKDDELFLSASDALPKSRKVESTPAGSEPAAQITVHPGGRGELRPMTIAPEPQVPADVPPVKRTLEPYEPKSPTPATIPSPQNPAPAGVPPSLSATSRQTVLADNSGPYQAIGLTDIPPPALPGPTHGTNVDAQPAKSNLRYDGRTFDQWQQDWLNRRQLDAFKALEAFSTAGYSREAANAILYGLFSEDASIAQHSRKFLASLPTDDQPAVVTQLIDVLKTDLGTKRRVAAARALAAIGPNAEPALEMLKKTLASRDLKERIASAAAIKMIVGKDKYQKPVADVLGKELGITVVESSSGVWGALPREDVKDNGEAFAKFTEAVIDEQQKLFPKGE